MALPVMSATGYKAMDFWTQGSVTVGFNGGSVTNLSYSWMPQAEFRGDLPDFEEDLYNSFFFSGDFARLTLTCDGYISNANPPSWSVLFPRTFTIPVGNFLAILIYVHTMNDETYSINGFNTVMIADFTHDYYLDATISHSGSWYYLVFENRESQPFEVDSIQFYLGSPSGLKLSNLTFDVSFSNLYMYDPDEIGYVPDVDQETFWGSLLYPSQVDKDAQSSFDSSIGDMQDRVDDFNDLNDQLPNEGLNNDQVDAVLGQFVDDLSSSGASAFFSALYADYFVGIGFSALAGFLLVKLFLLGVK